MNGESTSSLASAKSGERDLLPCSRRAASEAEEAVATCLEEDAAFAMLGSADGPATGASSMRDDDDDENKEEEEGKEDEEEEEEEARGERRWG